MARLLKEIEWLDPVLPAVEDPEWSAEIKRAIGFDAPAFHYVTPSRWIRTTKLRCTQSRPKRASNRLGLLAVLVTSQENSCRYCYGSARQGLRILGLSAIQLDEIERQVQMSGANEDERAVLQFCRNLSRSSPRPARSEFEALIARGLDAKAMLEIASIVGCSCFTNRAASFLAVPLDAGIEEPPGFFFRLGARVLGVFYPRPIGSIEPLQPGEPFQDVMALLDGTDGALILGDAIRNAFASPVLPVRTKAWVFAVVGRALGCHLCSANAERILATEGVDPATQERVLGALSGAELDPTETVLLPWLRETVHYKTEVMQRRTRELRDQVGPEITLEAIGLAALANSCARLSMLAQ